MVPLDLCSHPVESIYSFCHYLLFTDEDPQGILSLTAKGHKFICRAVTQT